MIVVGATAGELREACPVRARAAPVSDKPQVVVADVLTLVDVPPSTPIFLAAEDVCVDAATVFARRCDQSDRRLRPSDSISLEAAELLRHYAVRSGWHGPAYVVTSVGCAGRQSLRLARAMAAQRDLPAVVCEVYAAAEPHPDRGNASGPYLIVAATVTGAGVDTSLPVTAPPPYNRCALLGGES